MAASNAEEETSRGVSRRAEREPWRRARVGAATPLGNTTRETTMGRGLLLWLIGIPLPIILIVWLLGGLHG